MCSKDLSGSIRALQAGVGITDDQGDAVMAARLKADGALLDHGLVDKRTIVIFAICLT